MSAAAIEKAAFGNDAAGRCLSARRKCRTSFSRVRWFPIGPRNYTRESGLRRARENTPVSDPGRTACARPERDCFCARCCSLRSARGSRSRSPAVTPASAAPGPSGCVPIHGGQVLCCAHAAKGQAPALLARPDDLEHSEPLDRRTDGHDLRAAGGTPSRPRGRPPRGDGSPESGGFIRRRRRAPILPDGTRSPRGSTATAGGT